MEKKNLIYLTVFVLIILIVSGFYLFTQNGYIPNENLEDNKNNENSVAIGSEILNLKPGDSEILSEDLRIRFGRSGTEFSVPDIILGEHYNLNDPQNINYLPIYNSIKLYNNGKVVSLQKQECTIKDVFTDSPERHIVYCKVKMDIADSATPKISEIKVVETIEGSHSTRPIYRPDYVMTVQGQMVSEEPLLYVGIPEFFLRDWRNYSAGIIIGGAPGRSGGEDYKLGFTIITNFGIAELIYVPSELFDEVTKNIQIGPAVISITPQKNVVRNENTNEDFSFQVSMNFNDNLSNYPVKILNFTY